MTHSSSEPATGCGDLFGQAGWAVARLASATADLFGPPAGHSAEEAASVLAVFARTEERRCSR